jgi:hypothetical protein
LGEPPHCFSRLTPTSMSHTQPPARLPASRAINTSALRHPQILTAGVYDRRFLESMTSALSAETAQTPSATTARQATFLRIYTRFAVFPNPNQGPWPRKSCPYPSTELCGRNKTQYIEISHRIS